MELLSSPGMHDVYAISVKCSKWFYIIGFTLFSGFKRVDEQQEKQNTRVEKLLELDTGQILVLNIGIGLEFHNRSIPEYY